MVAKISTGGNMFGALAYNQNKVDSEEAKVLFSNRMLLGEDGNFSIGECMRSFEMQMPVQLFTKKPILHISINPHPEDVLTDQQLSDIAKEYMRKLGYGDQPYLVYKHTDIDRHHIHIVGLRVDENGRPLNARFEHRRSKQITRELEQKYNLHPAERKARTERPVSYTHLDVYKRQELCRRFLVGYLLRNNPAPAEGGEVALSAASLPCRFRQEQVAVMV